MKKIIETERLFLREMNMDDYDALFKVLADPDIMQHYPYTFDEERVRSWIERNMNRYKNDGFGLWAVCLKETNTQFPALYSYCKYTNTGSFKTAESIGMRFLKEYPDEDNKITHVSVIRREDL